MYLSHTWSGETNLKEYYKTLKDIDENMHEAIQKYHISGIIAGMDAQVEVKPNREPSVGGGTRVSRGNTAKYYELGSKFERLLMEWSTKHEVKLATTLYKIWILTRAKTDKLDYWKQGEKQFLTWKFISVTIR